jgi:hypothetical protein
MATATENIPLARREALPARVDGLIDEIHAPARVDGTDRIYVQAEME